MDPFNREDLERLADQENELCISLYMPTVRFESDQSQNPIRYRNLLKKVRKQLRSKDYRDNTIDDILESAEALLDRTSFWRNLSEGIAGFITPDTTSFYRLPIDFDEVVTTGERFHLKPLFPLMASNEHYFMLTLSLNDVRLYEGTQYAIDEISSADIPSSIAEAIRQYDDPEKQLQHRTSNRSVGRQDQAYHGHGSAGSDDSSARPKDEIRRFFNKIDDSLRDRLRGESVPLILAGVKEYLPVYKSVNSYQNLIDDQIIAGNPERLSNKDLHEKSWEIVEPVFKEKQDEAVKHFKEVFHADGELASDDFHEIIPAAAYSRVESLFVPIDQHRWGRYDKDTNTVELHTEQEPGDEDLLNYAAVQSYLNGADVYALPSEEMPESLALAATFRYRADVQAAEQ